MLDSAATDLERFSPSEQFAAAAVLEMPGPDVLVVEDDVDCGHALGVWLGGLGHSVATLRDGTRVVRWIEQNEPKLVLLDLGLPGMHGLKILHELRMLGLSAPVVVVTAQGSPEVAARARAMGAVAVLGKPIDRQALRPLLDELLPEQFGAQVTWSPNAATTIPSRHVPSTDDMSAMRGLARTWLRRRNATRGGARS